MFYKYLEKRLIKGGTESVGSNGQERRPVDQAASMRDNWPFVEGVW